MDNSIEPSESYIALRLQRRFRLASKFCSAGAIALGADGLIGWALDSTRLKSLHPFLVSMKPNTALLFILMGIAILLERRASPYAARYVLAAIVMTVSLATLAEYVLGVSLGIDQLLFADSPSTAAYRGGMAPATALSFLFVSIAVLIGELRHLRHIYQISILIPTASMILAICGHLFGVGSLHTIRPYSSVALHPAAGLLLLCAAIVFARPTEGIMSIASSDTGAGRSIRILLPFVVFIPIALGWLGLAGQRAGLYDATFGLALLVVGSVGSLAVALGWAATTQYRLETATGRAYAALVSSEARKTAILDSALDALVTIDDQGVIIEFNPAAEQMFGYAKADVLGQRMSDVIIPPALRDLHNSGFARYLDTGETTILGRVVEFPALRRDGSEFPVELAVTQVAGQTPPLFTGHIRDITERQRATDCFRLALDAAPAGMVMVDQNGKIMLVNSRIEELFGYNRAELIGESIHTLVPDRFRSRHRDFVRGFFSDPRARPMGAGRDLYGLRRDGTEVPVEIGLNPIKGDSGPLVIASVVDIAERKRADEERGRLLDELQTLARDLESRVEIRTRAVRESEARYRTLFDESPVSLWEKNYADTKGILEGLQFSEIGDLRTYLLTHPDVLASAAETVKVLAVNRRSLELFEAENEEQLLQGLNSTLDVGATEAFVEECLALMARKAVFELEETRRTLKGRRLDISLRLVPMPGHESDWSRVVASMVDITASKDSERKLRESIRQQEVLLKEIHHRVKNNLAVISSLFYLESLSATDNHTRSVFEDSQRRVRSMALVHETLYGSADLAAINFGEYARSLTAEWVSSYVPYGNRIRLKMDLQPVKMSLDQAVPCGLILNELISNAFKHAFPNGKTGEIQVTVQRTGDGLVAIAVSDDGVGLPVDRDIEAPGSLGLRLIRSLALQVGGRFEIVSRHPGTEARLTFAGDASVKTD